MKVSVITPSYNQGQFIGRTLHSVASQGSPNFELEHVVFDGGSTDDTVNILERFAHPVRWVSKPDKGQANAVNMGISTTDGEIIGWLNSDDIYYPEAISLVVTYFLENPDIDIVYGRADHINVDDVAFEEYPSEEWNFERLKETCFICQPALFFRRKVVNKIGLLAEDLNYCMDYEYWIRMHRNGLKFGFLQKKLAGSRLYADNKTLGNKLSVHREINIMLKGSLGIVPDRWIFNYAHVRAGHNVNRVSKPIIFILLMLWISIYTALIMNKKISKEMLRYANKTIKNLIKY